MHELLTGQQKDYPSRPDINESILGEGSSHALMVKFVGEQKRVLDVGCASGYLAQVLKQRRCEVVGIDSNPRAAEEARKYCSFVAVADLDNASLAEIFKGDHFDAIIFGDVLEHLRDPGHVLEDARALLSEDAFVVASIPNVAHGAIRLALMQGHFDYQEFGILDDSHMRFFTSKTIDELFLAAGYRIDVLERTRLGIFEPSDLIPTLRAEDFSEEALREVRADPECETLQFVFKAFPLTDEARYRALSKRFLLVNTELAHSASRLTRHDTELARLRHLLEERTHELEETRGYLGTAEKEMRNAQHAYVSAMEDIKKAEALDVRVEHLQSERDDLGLRLEAALEGLRKAEAQAHQMELKLTRLDERATFQTVAFDDLTRRYSASVDDAMQLRQALSDAAANHARDTTRIGELELTLAERSSSHAAAVEELQRRLDGALGELQTMAHDSEISRATSAEREQRDTAELERLRSWDEQLRQDNAALDTELHAVEARIGELELTLAERSSSHAAAVEELQRRLDGALGELQTMAHDSEISRATSAEREQRDTAELERLRSWDEQLRQDNAALDTELHAVEARIGELELTLAERSSSHAAAVEELQRRLDGALGELQTMAHDSEISRAISAEREQRDTAELERLRSWDEQLWQDYAALDTELHAVETSFQEFRAQKDREVRILQTERDTLEDKVTQLHSEGQARRMADQREAQRQLAQSQEVIASLEAERDRSIADLQQHISQLHSQIAASSERNAQLDVSLADLRAENERLKIDGARLARALSKLEDRMFQQTNDQIGRAQAELHLVSETINAVQASKFWRLKSLLARLRLGGAK